MTETGDGDLWLWSHTERVLEQPEVVDSTREELMYWQVLCLGGQGRGRQKVAGQTSCSSRRIDVSGTRHLPF